jgi:coenzyme F420 hydrogenase subunit delta
MGTEACIPEFCLKPTLVLGCGSVFRGDDGLGSQAIAFLLDHCALPDDVAVLDAGSGVGEVLFDIVLSPQKPKRIVLVDALDRGLPAGTISVLPLADLSRTDSRFFSFHQGPSSSLLRELAAVGAEVILVAVQPESLPDELTVGLSGPVQGALREICQIIVSRIVS